MKKKTLKGIIAILLFIIIYLVCALYLAITKNLAVSNVETLNTLIKWFHARIQYEWFNIENNELDNLFIKLQKSESSVKPFVNDDDPQAEKIDDPEVKTEIGPEVDGPEFKTEIDEQSKKGTSV